MSKTLNVVTEWKQFLVNFCVVFHLILVQKRLPDEPTLDVVCFHHKGKQLPSVL